MHIDVIHVHLTEACLRVSSVAIDTLAMACRPANLNQQKTNFIGIFMKRLNLFHTRKSAKYYYRLDT